MAAHPLPLRQRNRTARQLGRAQPATLRVVNAAKTAVDATQGAERSAVGRHGERLRPFNRQHLGNFPGALLVKGQLAHTAPLMVEFHALSHQCIVLTTGKRKGGTEEIFQRIGSAVQQRVECALAVA